MTQLVSIYLCLVVVALVALDDRKGRTSTALWLPVVWLWLAGSRMISQWFGAGVVASDQTILEGSPIDRNFLTFLLACAVIVLISRGRRVGAMLRANAPILVFLLYCAISVSWSDFADVAFKRWIKALGDVAMVLIILTDLHPGAAVRRVLARTGLLLIPTSVLLINVLHVGVQYSGGPKVIVGISNNKNMLGLDCMVFGLGASWRFLQVLANGERKGRKGTLIGYALLFAMAVWLLLKGSMMASTVCLFLATGLIAVIGWFNLQRKPVYIHFLVVGALIVASAGLFLNVGLVEKLGRDPTLTGRTEIWHEVLELTTNPLLGAGFESFWMGDRLHTLWDRHWWHPNEAHNGYLEVFLNLGWVGLVLLAVLMVTGYRNVISGLRRDPEIGSLRVAFFMVVLIYSLTEAGFRMMSPVWIFFLWSTMAVPAMRSKGLRPNVTGLQGAITVPETVSERDSVVQAYRHMNPRPEPRLRDGVRRTNFINIGAMIDLSQPSREND